MAENIKEMIKRHEGFRDRVYVDSVGVLTVGYGHALLPGSKVSQAVCDLLFEADFRNAYVGAVELCNDHGVVLGTTRLCVIIDMCFNLGPDRLRKFKKMWAALQQHDYSGAAAEMLDSKWATQVGKRAHELSAIMATGRFANE